MNKQADANTSTPPSPRSWISYVLVTLVCLAGVLVVVYLFAQSRQHDVEVIEAVRVAAPTEARDLNLGQVIDARRRRDLKAQEGYRYRVMIENESEDGAAGVTHIGGLVTFVPGTRPGEEVIIEITRLKRSTADAVVLQRMERPSAFKDTPVTPSADTNILDAATCKGDDVLIGRLFRARVTDRSKKFPERDGVIKIGGLVTFVPNSQPGDNVIIRIIKREPRFAEAELIRKEP